MSIRSVGLVARLLHHPTPPGAPLQFFLAARRADQPAAAQRLFALTLDDLTALAASLNAAIASARVQRARDAGMIEGGAAHG